MIFLKNSLLSSCRRISGLGLAVLALSAQLHAVSALDGKYKSATVSAGTIIALDLESNLYTSSDSGASFTLRRTTAETYEAVQALGTTAVAVGVDGLILRSTNSGTSWSSANSPVLNNTLLGVAARNASPDPRIWVAVGYGGFDGVVYRSADNGAQWTVAATLPGILLEDVVWSGTRWVACGQDDFTGVGVAYTSTDGVNWSASDMPLGTFVDPLQALATDGSGNVIAVGANGEILRSTDHGLTFQALADGTYSPLNLYSVIVDGNGTFYAGGDGKLVVEISGSSVSTAVPYTSSAPPVLDFILIDGEPVATGSFETPPARLNPLTLEIDSGGSKDYVLTVNETLAGQTYYLETTIDLKAGDWVLASESGQLGDGTNPITFEVDKDGVRRFWRVVEF